jgi:hypothetical protein
VCGWWWVGWSPGAWAIACMQECCENQIRSSAAVGGVGGDVVVEWSDKHVSLFPACMQLWPTTHTKLLVDWVIAHVDMRDRPIESHNPALAHNFCNVCIHPKCSCRTRSH